MQVQFLSWKDPLEKEMATHNPLQYSFLENPMDKGAWWVIVHGVARAGHDLVAEQQHDVTIAYQNCI